jgi:predicted ATPase
LAGQGAILNIIGEAGVGKSRLLMEIREEVPGERLYWLEGSTLPFSQTISYWPFQEILRRFARINRDDGEAEAWDKFENKVKALFQRKRLQSCLTWPVCWLYRPGPAMKNK